MTLALAALALLVARDSPPSVTPVPEHKPDVVTVVMDHVTDSRTIDLQLPWPFDAHHEWTPPEWKVSVAGHVIDLSITKHVFWMWFSSLVLLVVLFVSTARRKGREVPTGSAGVIETFVLFIRDEIAIKNIGEHDADAYTPYLCTVFFFILFCGLVGVIPFTATATGNIAVTGSLAILTFLLTQVAGMRHQGVLGYWGHLVPAGVPWWLYPIMLFVEILGLFTKPFALTIRLFANMIAGHIVILFLLGLIFILGSVLVAPVAVAFAIGIYLLELIVIVVQSYIFTTLSALFIGMATEAH